MARRAEHRVVTACVVGLSGTEKEKGVTGIGKSCLCNRFMDPRADNYHTDHISVLSQSDFGGQVVNNDHYLYWGEVTKTSDEGVDFTFRVVEQTEFVDDSSFQPFKCGKTEPYYKRCAQTRLQSAEKLKYLCKAQLGLEHELEQVFMPDGKLMVDGFLCLYDVSMIQDRPVERLVEFTGHILSNLLKTKKPVILVTTKNDESQDRNMHEVERLLARKEFRNFTIPIIETSAHKNVNIELAFITLAHMIDKVSSKTRLKTTLYGEAARTQKELREVARDAYLNLIQSHVTDHKALWTSVLCKIKQNDNYTHFQDLCGTDEARRLFHRHVVQLKEQYLQRRQDIYLEQLGQVLRKVLPDLSIIADRSWPATVQWLQRQDFFEHYFVIVPDGGSWRSGDFIDSMDQRIPFDLLDIKQSELVFRNHVSGLRAEQKRNDLMMQFKHLLEKNQNLTGKSLGETAIFFIGHQSFSGLSEEDKNLIYEQHQEELRETARANFIELLQENAAIFTKFETTQVTEEDLKDIQMKLQAEPRFRALGRLEQDRKVILLNHLGFVQGPAREKCAYRADCMENLLDGVLSNKAHRPQSWSRNSQFLLDTVDNQLNLVLLGAGGLSEQLAHEIRLLCVEDEYTLGGEIFSLDYRPIDGDVSLPQNSFKTADFKPHGCFCVFNSVATFMYLVDNLRKTLMNDLQRSERLPFQGLPVVVVLAHNPHVGEKELYQLRDEGQSLADRLQCPFIDTPSSLMMDKNHLFHQDQIGLAMHNLVKCIQHRSSFVQPWQIAESIEPDIRIIMCFMCGDSFQVDLPLAPLLNHQCCYVTNDMFPTITLETYLDDSKRKVEVTVTSYHGGTRVKRDLYHGYILVYSAKRKASLSNLSAFASNIPPVPSKMIAVTESGAANAFFSSESEQSLIVEGNAIADKLQIQFMITCANFRQQTASYTPFFKECWDRKMNTEQIFQFSNEAPVRDNRGYEPVRNRPPMLPPNHFSFAKSSTSNSTDSDPINDRPHMIPCQSDSEPDDPRVSSTSPPLRDQQEDGDDMFGLPDTEHLLKPSDLKYKRAIYAGYEDGSTVWENQHADKRSPTPTVPKPKPNGACAGPGGKLKIGALDIHKYNDVCQVIKRNIKTGPIKSLKGPKAPLATPEHIEIQGDYAQVKDALPDPTYSENTYASVVNALPFGKIHHIRSTIPKKKKDKGTEASDTDSELSSMEHKEDIYSRVHRRPTPHKKRNKPKHVEIPVPPPPLPPYTDERQLLVQDDQLDRYQNSMSEGSDGTADELHNLRRNVKKKRSFKKHRSPADAHRFALDGAALPCSDSNLTDSPHSKASADDDGSFDASASGEFTPRGKSKEQMRKEAKEDKRRKKKKVPTATLR